MEWTLSRRDSDSSGVMFDTNFPYQGSITASGRPNVVSAGKPFTRRLLVSERLRISLAGETAPNRKRGGFRLFGFVDGLKPGARIRIEERDSGRSYRSVASLRVGADGNFTKQIRAAGGNYFFRAVSGKLRSNIVRVKVPGSARVANRDPK